MILEMSISMVMLLTLLIPQFANSILHIDLVVNHINLIRYCNYHSLPMVHRMLAAIVIVFLQDDSQTRSIMLFAIAIDFQSSSIASKCCSYHP